MDGHSEWNPYPTGQNNSPSNRKASVEFSWQPGAQQSYPRNSQSPSHVHSEVPWQSFPQQSHNFNAPSNFYPSDDTNFNTSSNYSKGRANIFSKKKNNLARNLWSADAKKKKRVWSAAEEEQLLIGLKECVANGMKSDNGFRTGYLGALEQHLNNQFPGTDLRGDPHILSKIHVWKKQHSSLSTMMGMSGFGWDERTCMIIVDDPVWDAYLKIDKDAKSMRKKSFPFHEDWALVFGKDRANGEYRTTISDALNDLCANDKAKSPTSPSVATSNVKDKGKRPTSPAMDTSPTGHSPRPRGQCDTDSAMPSRTRCETVNSPSKGEKAARKRQRVQDGDTAHVVNLMGKFFGEISSHMGGIKENLGTEREAIEMRRQVIDAIRRIESLTFKDKLEVTARICEKPTDVDMFLRLDNDDRTVMATMIARKEY